MVMVIIYHLVLAEASVAVIVPAVSDVTCAVASVDDDALRVSVDTPDASKVVILAFVLVTLVDCKLLICAFVDVSDGMVAFAMVDVVELKVVIVPLVLFNVGIVAVVRSAVGATRLLMVPVPVTLTVVAFKVPIVEVVDERVVMVPDAAVS